MPDKQELLPCDCGGQAIMTFPKVPIKEVNELGQCQVLCKKCGKRGTLFDSAHKQQEAITAWNTRAESEKKLEEETARADYLSVAVGSYKAKLAELTNEISEIFHEISEIFHIGDDARNIATILGNIRNAARRSSCLSMIENFHVETLTDDYGEKFDVSKLNWGEEPKQYAETYKKIIQD